MIDAECFPEDHAAISFQDALPPLVNGEAAMYLMGSFVAASFPDDVRPDVGFKPFPTVDPSVPRAEDVTLDTIAIPARADNKEDARTFVRFMARPDVQSEFNAAMDRLPLVDGSTVSDDPLTQAGYEITSGAQGAGQFFDRDTNPELAQTALEGFQRFMFFPGEADAILDDLTRTQSRIAER